MDCGSAVAGGETGRVEDRVRRAGGGGGGGGFAGGGGALGRSSACAAWSRQAGGRAGTDGVELGSTDGVELGRGACMVGGMDGV